MPDRALQVGGQVRSTELVGALCLATDLGMGFPFEHGLHTTLIAMRLADRLGVDRATASQTYYGCLLFYVGCTAGAELAADVFGDDDALTTFGTPARFGARPEMVRGMLALRGDFAQAEQMQRAAFDRPGLLSGADVR